MQIEKIVANLQLHCTYGRTQGMAYSAQGMAFCHHPLFWLPAASSCHPPLSGWCRAGALSGWPSLAVQMHRHPRGISQRDTQRTKGTKKAPIHFPLTFGKSVLLLFGFFAEFLRVYPLKSKKHTISKGIPLDLCLFPFFKAIPLDLCLFFFF